MRGGALPPRRRTGGAKWRVLPPRSPAGTGEGGGSGGVRSGLPPPRGRPPQLPSGPAPIPPPGRARSEGAADRATSGHGWPMARHGWRRIDRVGGAPDAERRKRWEGVRGGGRGAGGHSPADGWGDGRRGRHDGPGVGGGRGARPRDRRQMPPWGGRTQPTRRGRDRRRPRAGAQRGTRPGGRGCVGNATASS